MLINGVFGIVVGMVINIFLYNLGEVIDGCLVYIDNEVIIIDELMDYIFGLDFLIVVLISGCKGIIDVYKTGCGKVYMCLKVEIEIDKNGKEIIIVSEIFY